MTYERNFNLMNRKFRELFFTTLITSIAGNFAVPVDAFFISMFMGSVYLSVLISMTIEDMIVRIIEINDNADLIDVIIRDSGDYILI